MLFYAKRPKIDMGHTTVYTGMEHTRKDNRIGCKKDANKSSEVDHYENAVRSYYRLYVRSVLVVTSCSAMEHINTVCQILEVLLIFIWHTLVIQLFWHYSYSQMPCKL